MVACTSWLVLSENEHVQKFSPERNQRQIQPLRLFKDTSGSFGGAQENSYHAVVCSELDCPSHTTP